MTEYFMTFSAGIGTLAVLCGAVWWTIRQGNAPLKTEITNLNSRFTSLEEKVGDMEKKQSDNEKALGEKLDIKLEALYNAINTLKDLLSDKYCRKEECDKQFKHCKEIFGHGKN